MSLLISFAVCLAALLTRPRPSSCGSISAIAKQGYLFGAPMPIEEWLIPSAETALIS